MSELARCVAITNFNRTALPSCGRYLPAIVGPAGLGLPVSALYSAVIAVNVVGSSFMMMYLSFIPGAARERLSN